MLFSLQKINFETTSFPQTAINGNRSLVHFYQFLYQRKADSGTCLIEYILIYQILKAYKERLTFVFGNTNSLILHTNRYRALIFADKNGNHFPVRRIFKGVGQKIKYNLFKLISIYPKVQSLLLRLEEEIDMMLLRH